MKCNMCYKEAQLHFTEVRTETDNESGKVVKFTTTFDRCTDHPTPETEQEAKDIKAFEAWMHDYPKWIKEGKKKKGPPMIIALSLAWKAGVQHGRSSCGH